MSVSKYVLAYVPFCLPRFLSLGHNILPPWHPTELKSFYTLLILVTPLIFTVKICCIIWVLSGGEARHIHAHTHTQTRKHTHTHTCGFVFPLLSLLSHVHSMKRNTFSDATELTGLGWFVIWLINKSNLLDSLLTRASNYWILNKSESKQLTSISKLFKKANLMWLRH